VSDRRGARGPLTSLVVKTDLTERLIGLASGENPGLGNFSVKLLGKVDGLKFACPGRDGKDMGNTMVRFVSAYLRGGPR